MSDLAVIAPSAPIVAAATDLVRFAEEASQVHQISTALANTSFVPKAMQGRPDEITGCILAGRELGMSPMTALASINIIEGRPSLTANAMRGLAQAHGVQFEVISSSDTRVQMRARGPNDTEWTPVDWPIDRAKKMELTSKRNWQRMPQAMLIARATSELCRLVASNLFLGMPYSSEEVADIGPDAPVRRPRKSAPIPATVEPPEEPPLEPPSDDEPPVPDGPVIGAEPDGPAELPADAPILPATRAAIMAGFTELGIKDRADRLAKVSTVVGREVGSVNVLTNAEGRAVVRKLQEIRSQGWSA